MFVDEVGVEYCLSVEYGGRGGYNNVLSFFVLKH